MGLNHGVPEKVLRDDRAERPDKGGRWKCAPFPSSLSRLEIDERPLTSSLSLPSSPFARHVAPSLQRNKAVTHCKAGGAFLSKVNFPEISSYDKEIGRKAFETSKKSLLEAISSMPREHARLLEAGIEPMYYVQKPETKYARKLSTTFQQVLRPGMSLGLKDPKEAVTPSVRKKNVRMTLRKKYRGEEVIANSTSKPGLKDRRFSVLSSLLRSDSPPPGGESPPIKFSPTKKGIGATQAQLDALHGGKSNGKKSVQPRSISAAAHRRTANVVTEVEKMKVGLDDTLKQKLGRFKRDRISTYRRKFNALCGDSASLEADEVMSRPITAPVWSRSGGQSLKNELQTRRPATREVLYNSSANNVSQELAKARCWAEIEATQEAILRMEDQAWCSVLMAKLSKSSNRSTGLLHGESLILDEVTKSLVEGSHFGQQELINILQQFSQDDFLSKDVEELVSILVRATHMTMGALEKCYTEILGAVTAHEALNCLDANQKQNMISKRFKDSRRHRAETTANLYIQKYRKKISSDTSVQHLLKRMNK